MAETVRAAAVQLSPVFDEQGGTLRKVCDAVAEAATRGAELVVFPETFIPYYPYFSFVRPPALSGPEHLRLYEGAIRRDGPEAALLASTARRHGVVLVVGVNERDHGSLYNTQLVFDADGTLLLARRKLTPTFHERMIWGQGDGSGLKVVDSAVGRVGALACWEHYNPLARYALMTQHEAIHCAQFPGSMVGQLFADQIEVTIRHHALESGCFVVCSTGTMSEEQVAAISPDPALRGALRGGSFTAIVSPEGKHLAPPLTEGEGMLVADLDLSLITKRKRMMDSVGHYARPELLKLWMDPAPQGALHTDPGAPSRTEPRTPAPKEDDHAELC
jgi:nitrilase